MTIITKITTQKKQTDRYNIFIDKGKGEEFGFAVSQDVLIAFDLKKGKEIDEEELRDIMYKEDVQKAFNRAVQFLSHRMRSMKEIRDHLKRKETEEDIIPLVMEKLSKLKYVNDLEFGKAYVRTQARTSSKGPGVIEKELMEKGLTQAEIRGSMPEYTKEEQIENATKLATKKAAQSKKRSANEMRQKIKATLMQKGYSAEVVAVALESMSMDAVTDDQQQEALEYQGAKAHKRYRKYEGWEYERRMKQYLYRKGFQMESIDAFIQKMKDQESAE